jgi:HSP20 family protein
MPTRKGAIKDLAELQGKLNHIITDIMEPGVRPESEPSFAWSPPTDICEDECAFYVEMELSGVDIGDVEVTCEERSLKVEGERKVDKELAPKNVQRMERFFGRFSREFTFLSSVDPKKVDASLTDGVLTLILPKKTDKKRIVVK